MGDHVFGNGKDAGLSIELDPVGGIRRKLDFPGSCPKPGDHVSNGTAAPELCNQEFPVGRVVPDPELVDRTPQHLFPAISVPAFKRGIHFEKSSFLKGCNRERDGTRMEYLLKLLLGTPAARL